MLYTYHHHSFFSIYPHSSVCNCNITTMASLAHHCTGALRCSPFKPFFSPSKRSHKLRSTTMACSVQLAIGTAETKERYALKQLFQEAYERCRANPSLGPSFTPEDFANNLDRFEFSPESGSKVIGTVMYIDKFGATVDVNGKGSAFLPIEEASMYYLNSVEEAGIVPEMTEEFEIIGDSEEDEYEDDDDTLVLSLKTIQQDYAWERCRQLLAEDITVKGRVISANKGGLAVLVEGLQGFVPFSHMSSNAMAEELLEKEIPLKVVEIDEDEGRIIFSNRKAMSDSQTQLGIGSVVTGTVQSLKPYGAFIDIGGINGLLHVSQISHDRVSDIETVLQPGDTLKVMILSHDRERGRVSLSTKKLEPTPGDMIRNPALVFEKAEEMAQTFRQRIALAESMARADMLRFQPESGLTLSSEGILGPLTPDLPFEGLDLSGAPLAED